MYRPNLLHLCRAVQNGYKAIKRALPQLSEKSLIETRPLNFSTQKPLKYDTLRLLCRESGNARPIFKEITSFFVIGLNARKNMNIISVG